MKITAIYLVLALLLVVGCKETPERPGAILDENYEPIVPVNTPAATTPPATNEPPQNAAGVWHYTCSTGCAGGAGSAVPCATCGSTLVHNTAYHNNAGGNNPAGAITPTGTVNAGANGNTNIGSITNPIVTGIDPPAGAPTSPPKAPEPAQNAAGVWHYTCSAGCAGGAGSAVPCATCGATLVHNSGYH